MSFYGDLISQITGETDQGELIEIEEIMRDQTGGTLSGLRLEELEAMAHMAFQARQLGKLEESELPFY